MIRVTKKLMPQEPFALALSGGEDSIAVCHFLVKSRKKFIALHVNGKYIPQDDICEQRVRSFCSEYKVPLVVSTVQSKFSSKRSVEAWCREERYKLLLQDCKKQKIRELVVCHHLDDCVESYLMNCFNGVPEYTPIPFKTQYTNVSLTRPFLLTKKKDFSGYISRHRLEKFVTQDELNGDLSLQRNWIRHQLRPIIETRYKGISTVVRKLLNSRIERI